ncbi:hypothetical protein [Amnibacterium kyonggiense]|uniref:Uncharacterized protein n=1 Tax=Amnibacterium kyonggiense TaxID=595671 RepID=A0A4R7FQM8_9MICO|nr:hypothetical protein [Amnibacterium kyonggiense]TDS80095.1 hypothetical protein CLV52_0648 [Amnibacterium kyonggiense]
MPSIRFRLEKPTLTGLAARVAAEFGPEARILDTEESIVGGIAGLFGKRVIDVTVELPDRAAPEGAHEFSMRSRVGLAALLDDADAADLGPASAYGDDPWMVPAPPAQVSTQGGDFASVLDALRIDVEPGETGGGTPARPLRRTTAAAQPQHFTQLRPQRPAAPPAPMRAVTASVPVRALEAPSARHVPVAPAAPAEPTPAEVAAVQQYVWATSTPRSRMGRTTPGAPPPQRTRAGDLLLLVGIGDDAMHVAKSLRDRMQRGYVCDGGTLEGNTRRRVDDRRGAVAARAYGVRSDQPVIVAYGVGRGPMAEEELEQLLSIDSDQSWLVVDAAKDAEETLEWTGRLRGRLQVDAVASLRAQRGVQHEALAAIGLPEAYRELAG